MFTKTLLSALFALGLGATSVVSAEVEDAEDIAFSFEGVFGKFDQEQLQRGLQVYTEVCASCHGLNLVAYRNLGDHGGVGLPEDQVKAYAAQFETFDPELDNGEGDFRTSTPADYFPTVYNPDLPAPDLSLMAKARKGFTGPYGLAFNPLFKGVGGPERIVAILRGYTGEEKEEAGSILYENEAFPGGWISMPPPIVEGDIFLEYVPAHDNDLDALSEDVAAFLMWTAEPKLMDRKKAGLVAVLFLTFLAVMLYLTNKKIWAKAKRKD